MQKRQPERRQHQHQTAERAKQQHRAAAHGCPQKRQPDSTVLSNSRTLHRQRRRTQRFQRRQRQVLTSRGNSGRRSVVWSSPSHSTAVLSQSARHPTATDPLHRQQSFCCTSHSIASPSPTYVAAHAPSPAETAKQQPMHDAQPRRLTLGKKTRAATTAQATAETSGVSMPCRSAIADDSHSHSPESSSNRRKHPPKQPALRLQPQQDQDRQQRQGCAVVTSPERTVPERRSSRWRNQITDPPRRTPKRSRPQANRGPAEP